MAETSRAPEGASYVGPPKPDYLDRSRDLLERLRQMGDPGIADECTYEELDRAALYDEAADEIERLRAVVEDVARFAMMPPPKTEKDYDPVLVDLVDGVFNVWQTALLKVVNGGR